MLFDYYNKYNFLRNKNVMVAIVHRSISRQIAAYILEYLYTQQNAGPH